MKTLIIPLLTSLSADGKVQLMLVVVAFVTLMFLIGFSGDIKSFLLRLFRRKQHPLH